MTEAVAAETAQSWCPSGDARAPESVVLGVRSGADGVVTYLAEPVPAAEVLPDIPEGIEPTRILRFASHCVSSCANRDGADCALIKRILTVAPAEVPESASVPRCHLRSRCKWWAQSGVVACGQCPAVATANHVDDELAMLVADPATTQEQLEAWIAQSATAQSA